MTDSIIGQPAKDIAVQNLAFSNAVACNREIQTQDLSACDAIVNNLTVNNLNVINAMTPQPYIMQQIIPPVVLPANLQNGEAHNMIGTNPTVSTFLGSSNVTVGTNSWTINVAGDYVLDISVLITSVVITGTGGQPAYLAFNIPVEVNNVPVITFADFESLINVAVSTETFAVPFHFMTPLALNAGDVITLNIISTIPHAFGTSPFQSVRSWSVKLQKMSA